MRPFIVRSLIFFITVITIAPAFGYTWRVYNGLPEDAFVKFNVTGATRQMVVPAAGYEDFNGPRSICLTNIYVMRMSDTDWQHVKIQGGDPKLWSDITTDIQDFVKALMNPESPSAWLTLLKDLIKTLIDFLKILCSDGAFLLTYKDPKSPQSMILIAKK